MRSIASPYEREKASAASLASVVDMAGVEFLWPGGSVYSSGKRRFTTAVSGESMKGGHDEDDVYQILDASHVNNTPFRLSMLP